MNNKQETSKLEIQVENIDQATLAKLRKCSLAMDNEAINIIKDDKIKCKKCGGKYSITHLSEKGENPFIFTGILLFCKSCKNSEDLFKVSPKYKKIHTRITEDFFNILTNWAKSDLEDHNKKEPV